jgi:2-dehydropantoate 2-reductase
MRHAVLGAGGIGGLLAAALARAGADVLLLLRPETLAAYPGRIELESVVLGDGGVDVAAAARLEGPVDVVWIATKAPQLEAALALAPPELVGEAAVVPLLNGVEHVALLRTRYRHVVAAAIRVGSERVAPGVIRQRSPFLRVDLAGEPALAAELRRAGIACASRDDETTVLWDKLAMLAPLALATAASGAPLGAVRDDPRYAACEAEVVAVARAEGAHIDAAAIAAFRTDGPAAMQSSLQLDVERGGPTELDAIAGAVRRAAARHGIPTPATDAWASAVEARLAGR